MNKLPLIFSWFIFFHKNHGQKLLSKPNPIISSLSFSTRVCLQ
jgi:hypothetical protein